MAPRDTSSNSKESGFIWALENLRVSINEVAKYGSKIKTVEELQQERNIALQKRAEADAIIEKQQRRISDHVETVKSLEKEKEATIDAFERRFKLWATEEARLKSELQNIKADIGLNQHKELADLKKKSDDQGNQITSLKGQLDQQITLNTGLEERLLRAQTKLKDLIHSVGLEEIGPDFKQHVEKLEKDLHQIVYDYFYQGTSPSHAGRGHSQWTGLPCDWLPITPFSIHSTNSYIRVCAIQNILASKISKDIFQPLCIRAPSGIQSVGQVLERTTSLSGRQQAITCSLILKAFEEDEKSIRRSMITAIVLEISSIVGDLVHDRSAFEKDLTSLLNQATDLWLKTQKCAIGIRATMDVRISGVEWRAAGGSSKQGNPILAIFPFFMSDSQPLYQGLAVWPNDPALSPSIQATPRSVNKGRHQNSEPRTPKSLSSPAERSQKNALQQQKLD
uniref:Structural maintenance of chromosomes protein 3 n=1 Tax=Talaromyces marneffei PM1 TaxID=1077442 RepID=A0A093V377_TALMA